MENERVVQIIGYVCLLVAVIFLSIWIFKILFPLIDYAEFLAAMGFTYGGTVVEILVYLFLNPFFIIAAVFAIVALIILLIARVRF